MKPKNLAQQLAKTAAEAPAKAQRIANLQAEKHVEELYKRFVEAAHKAAAEGRTYCFVTFDHIGTHGNLVPETEIHTTLVNKLVKDGFVASVQERVTFSYDTNPHRWQVMLDWGKA